MNERDIRKTALLVAIACVLQIAESLIPHPVPGLRLGLANGITLIALVTMGFGAALEVTVLRTILSSFMMGTFMSPTFILSFAAGVTSTVVMGGLFWVSRLSKPWWLSIVGISILGSLTHNAVQLSLAYVILIRHSGVFMFLPWLCIGSALTGWLIGVVAGRVCLDLKEDLVLQTSGSDTAAPALRRGPYVPGDSFLHRVSAEGKIGVIILLSLTVIVFNAVWLYAVLFALLFLVMRLSGIPAGFLLAQARRYIFMIAVALLFPLLFSAGSQVLLHYAFLRITMEGVSQGALFALRILFLIWVSALLARTTAPTALADGLGKMLRPFRVFGISGERTARIFSLSWVATPVLWDISKHIIRGLELRKVRGLSQMIPLLSIFMTRLYRAAEDHHIWEKELPCAG